MKPIHHAPLRLFVPEGFSGWWCERCQKGVEIEDCLGSPARCPKCHKPTAVWIPTSDPVISEPVTSENCRKYVTKERGAELFEQAKALLEDVEAYDASRAGQQRKMNHE